MYTSLRPIQSSTGHPVKVGGIQAEEITLEILREKDLY